MTHTIDLHVHSCFSDGTCTPGQLIQFAKARGLSAIALTDHDTVAGIAEAIDTASGSGIELIPGIEMSCLYGEKDIHIVGLLIDHKNPSLLHSVRRYQNNRANRNVLMAEKLTAGGFLVTVPELERQFPGATLTRAHFAKFFVEKGLWHNKDEAFNKYIGEGCPFYVKKTYVSPDEAIDVIHRAGGIAILAHPLLYHMTDQELESMVAHLKTLGLDGIETMYSTYSDAQQLYMLHLAADYQLLKSGGSDFHGANKPDISLGTGYGKLRVPYSYLHIIKEYIQEKNQKKIMPAQ